MGHTGKHLIDPDTGLCDICDRDAIEDIRQGRVPVKRVFYGPDDETLPDKVMDEPYYPDVEEEFSDEDYENEIPQYRRRRQIRRPPIRSRRVIDEPPAAKPVYVRRRTVPADHYPEVEVVPRRRVPVGRKVIVRRPTQRQTFYYVDQDNQRMPRLRSPVRSPLPYYVSQEPTKHVVRSTHALPPLTPSSPRRLVRVIRRRHLTPSPVTNRPYDVQHRQRRIQSDSEIIEPPVQKQEKQPRLEHIVDQPEPSIKPVMYHIDASNNDHFDRFESPVANSHNGDHSPLTVAHQNVENRKRTQLEPIQREHEPKPTPTVIRRSYKPPPPEYDDPSGTYRPVNGKINQTIRGNPPNQPRNQYEAYKYSNGRNNPRDERPNDPSIYYIRSSNRP